MEAVAWVVKPCVQFPVKLVADQFGLDVVEEDPAEPSNYPHPHHTVEEGEHHQLQGEMTDTVYGGVATDSLDITQTRLPFSLDYSG